MRKKRIPKDVLEAARWFSGIAETCNDCYLDLFFDEHRFLILWGGGSSGKSIFAGRKIIERCARESGHRVLVIRKYATSLKNSCVAQLAAQAEATYPGRYKFKKSDYTITFDTGSEIIFKGCDDPEKIKSFYECTDMWIEEATELSEYEFNQLNIRMRANSRHYKQIIITFNPVSATHWIKARFFDKHDPLCSSLHTTYRDNRFLLPEDRQTLENFKHTDEYYYMVYCLGQWGVTGKTVFRAGDVSRRLEEVKNATRKEGVFVYDYDGLSIRNVQFLPGTGGYIKIYKPPERGVPYVIGFDTAGTGSDCFAAHVLDNRTGEQVAVLHVREIAEEEVTRQVYCLGIYYNDALLAPENNYSSYESNELQRLRYPRLYVQEQIDTYTHKPTKRYGFVTTKKTRPVAISTLVTAVNEDIGIINDRATLEEMLTFIRTEDFRAEAEAGAHDDLIMALAIAHYIRPKQDTVATLPPERCVEWTADMWEDYDRAGPLEREEILRLWGTPKPRR